MKKLIVLVVCLLTVQGIIQAQNTAENTSLLWKISGNELKEPSYLFGTMHLLTNTFVDTIPAIQEAYRTSQAVVGELLIDPSMQNQFMQASMLNGTTLSAVLPDSIYLAAEKWFVSEAGLDIKNLEAFNPMAVMTIAMAIAQQKSFPNPQGALQLDDYFQQKGKADGKIVLGLETIEVQVQTLFKDISLERQAVLLNSLLNSDETIEQQLARMYNAYLDQDLLELKNITYSGEYTQTEIQALLDNRNSAWIKKMPEIMTNQPTFFAVGALHLIGENGLLALLKQLGYSVEPVNI